MTPHHVGLSFFRARVWSSFFRWKVTLPFQTLDFHRFLMTLIFSLPIIRMKSNDIECISSQKFRSKENIYNYHYWPFDPFYLQLRKFQDFVSLQRLLGGRYLYDLRKSKETLPRRQEADSARCANNETALVTHDELKAWAKDPTRAIICSISHAWETREHPDPCGYQLEQVLNAVSLYEAAYEAEVWIFYDYTSLYPSSWRKQI